MEIPRYGSAYVVKSGLLFVIGGLDWKQQAYTNSVEYYVPLTKSWHAVTPMRHKRYGAAACTSGGLFYVFGGENTSGLLSSIEKYDPRDCSWSEVTHIYWLVYPILTESSLFSIISLFALLDGDCPS